MGGAKTVTWRGRRFDPRTRDMLVELAATVGPYISPTQGSYNTSVAASAGTHSGGGAVDISIKGWTSEQIWSVLTQARRVGFAMWHRRQSKSWKPHLHGIAIGCPDLAASAARQVTAYRNGRDGLAGNGPDDGPKVGFTTWEQYQANKKKASKKKRVEDYMTDPSAFRKVLKDDGVRQELMNIHAAAFRDGPILRREVKELVTAALKSMRDTLAKRAADYVWNREMPPMITGETKPRPMQHFLRYVDRNGYYAHHHAARTDRAVLAYKNPKWAELGDVYKILRDSARDAAVARTVVEHLAFRAGVSDGEVEAWIEPVLERFDAAAVDGDGDKKQVTAFAAAAAALGAAYGADLADESPAEPGDGLESPTEPADSDADAT